MTTSATVKWNGEPVANESRRLLWVKTKQARVVGRYQRGRLIDVGVEEYGQDSCGGDAWSDSISQDRVLGILKQAIADWTDGASRPGEVEQ